MAPLTRRTMLRSALVAGASTFAWRLPFAAGRDAPSLIVLWLQGGASQLETWDPHPRASTCGLVATSIRDVRIASFLPRMAERLHHLNVVRSIVSKEGDHARGTYAMKTGYSPNPTVVHPSLGAVLTRLRPPAKAGLPPHVSLSKSSWPAVGGHLGPAYDAFRVADPGRSLENLESRVTADREVKRQVDLEVVSSAFSHRRHTTPHTDNVRAARDIMSSEDLVAFDVEEEPSAVVDRYGDHRFGRACLVARRLVERGARAVEVTLSGFDSHVNNHEAHAEQVPVLDAAFSALVDDLVERDLLRRTLVVCMSEMGRTPAINALDGRDHWPAGFSCVLGGAGLAAGRVVGATDPTGGAPKDPVTVEDLFATILTGLRLDPKKELVTPAGRPVPLSRGVAVRGLLA